MSKTTKQKAYLKNKRIARPAMFILTAVLTISLALHYFVTKPGTLTAETERPPAASSKKLRSRGSGISL